MTVYSPPASRPRAIAADPAVRTIAVALHDVEPATFERCALIRDWLDDHGIDRVTLLVIPAPDLHPLSTRAPGIVEWLDERRCLGDAIAQHGFQHEQLRRVRTHSPSRNEPCAPARAPQRIVQPPEPRPPAKSARERADQS